MPSEPSEQEYLSGPRLRAPMDFAAIWGKFRRTPYFRMLYLSLVALLAAVLLPTTLFVLGCLTILVIPLLVLLVPHFFGERRVRNHAVNGLVAIILTSILYTAIAVPDVTGRVQVGQSWDGERADIAEGLVTPFRGAASASFNFTVNVTSDDPQRSQFFVRLQVADQVGLGDFRRNYTMTPLAGDNLTDGSAEYYATITLAPVFHVFNFQVWGPVNGTMTVLTETLGSVGPFNAPYEAYLSVIWVRAVYFMVVFIGMGFYLILMIYWWIAKAKQVRGTRAPPERKRAEGGGEFTCTNCGGDVGEEDAKCANCGAVFDAEAEDEPADPKA